MYASRATPTSVSSDHIRLSREIMLAREIEIEKLQ
jgi:hypothetical protein